MNWGLNAPMLKGKVDILKVIKKKKLEIKEVPQTFLTKHYSFN